MLLSNQKFGSSSELSNEATPFDDTNQIIDKIFDLYTAKTLEIIGLQGPKKSREEEVKIRLFIEDLIGNGIKKDDPRLKDMFQRLEKCQNDQLLADKAFPLHFNRDKFHHIVGDSIHIIKKVFTKSLIINDFTELTEDFENIFNDCLQFEQGEISDYLPQFKRDFGHDSWGMSICTVDGQRFNLGDSQVNFTLQSLIAPFVYSQLLNDTSLSYVREYIGIEASSMAPYVLELDEANRPYNPMINTGTILATAMSKPEELVADRFDYLANVLAALAGKADNEKLPFNNSTFLSERENADRNYALAYLMKEKKCYPKGHADRKFISSLDLYFQLNSIEANCEDVAHMAATLANGGVTPLTNKKMFEPSIIKHVLSLMLSCGCNKNSGEFAFEFGVPAKSAIQGALMLVIPNLCGICLWSPKLNREKISHRGIEFCKRLVDLYKFHHFDNDQNYDKIYNNNLAAPVKKDPRKTSMNDQRGLKIMQLMFAAQKGDLSALIRLHFQENDMTVSDYDGRTALHVAASEGHYTCCEYLLKTCSASPYTIDRWGKTAKDNAEEFNHSRVVRLINGFMLAEKTRRLHRRESVAYAQTRSAILAGELQVKILPFGSDGDNSGRLSGFDEPIRAYSYQHRKSKNNMNPIRRNKSEMAPDEQVFLTLIERKKRPSESESQGRPSMPFNPDRGSVVGPESRRGSEISVTMGHHSDPGMLSVVEDVLEPGDSERNSRSVSDNKAYEIGFTMSDDSS